MLLKMFFISSVCLLIYSLALIHCQESERESSKNFPLKCQKQDKAKDQVFNFFNRNVTANERRKRFVLFPEFKLFLNDWRYIHTPKLFNYWVANYYPKRLSTETVQLYVEDIIQKINLILDTEIIVTRAKDPGEANFYYLLFDYTKCPDEDPEEADTTVQSDVVLDIYPEKLCRESRYRAHGGIDLLENDRVRSRVKLNMQQTFLVSNDFVYDPIIYTCKDPDNICDIDLHFVLLHETLHGFGIEHTTNGQQPKAPNPRMQSVMHFSSLRILCHDDIRALRKIYNFTVIRDNAAYDDTCRRDFPMSFLQKLMALINKCLIYGSLILAAISFLTFILTVIYILLRSFISNRPASIKQEKAPLRKPLVKTNLSNKPHGYLWHDDMI